MEEDCKTTKYFKTLVPYIYAYIPYSFREMNLMWDPASKLVLDVSEYSATILGAANSDDSQIRSVTVEEQIIINYIVNELDMISTDYNTYTEEAEGGDLLKIVCQEGKRKKLIFCLPYNRLSHNSFPYNLYWLPDSKFVVTFVIDDDRCCKTTLVGASDSEISKLRKITEEEEVTLTTFISDGIIDRKDDNYEAMTKQIEIPTFNPYIAHSMSIEPTVPPIDDRHTTKAKKYMGCVEEYQGVCLFWLVNQHFVCYLQSDNGIGIIHVIGASDDQDSRIRKLTDDEFTLLEEMEEKGIVKRDIVKHTEKPPTIPQLIEVPPKDERHSTRAKKYMCKVEGYEGVTLFWLMNQHFVAYMNVINDVGIIMVIGASDNNDAPIRKLTLDEQTLLVEMEDKFIVRRADNCYTQITTKSGINLAQYEHTVEGYLDRRLFIMSYHHRWYICCMEFAGEYAYLPRIIGASNDISGSIRELTSGEHRVLEEMEREASGLRILNKYTNKEYLQKVDLKDAPTIAVSYELPVEGIDSKIILYWLINQHFICQIGITGKESNYSSSGTIHVVGISDSATSPVRKLTSEERTLLLDMNKERNMQYISNQFTSPQPNQINE